MSEATPPVVLPGSDAAIHRAFELRKEQRLATVPEPEFPATGSEMVAARLAEARAQQRNARAESGAIDLVGQDQPSLRIP